MSSRKTSNPATTFDRLHTLGATQNHQVRRRLRWLAFELRLPPEELPKTGRNSMEAEARFGEKYHVSLDWLLFGDLKGLQRMMREHKRRQARAPIVDQIMEKYQRPKSRRSLSRRSTGFWSCSNEAPAPIEEA
jgi:hypothetical protein